MEAKRKSERIIKEMSLPDLAAREPAEGDLSFPEGRDHLRFPDEAPSNPLPVEGGGLAPQAEE